MWIGDLKQPVGGVNKEQEEVGILLQKKRCCLWMLTGKPRQPREVESFLESHILKPSVADITPPEEEHAAWEEETAVGTLPTLQEHIPASSLC